MAQQTLALTDYLEDRLLNHIFRNTASTAPATVYLALYSVNPTEASGGTELAVANGYVRQSITFGAPASNTIANTNLITFGPATPAGWSTVVAVAVFDASAAGNMLCYCTGLNTPVAAGESVTVSVGALTILMQ